MPSIEIENIAVENGKQKIAVALNKCANTEIIKVMKTEINLCDLSLI